MEKIRIFLKIIKENGGFFKSLDRLYVTDDLKWGCKVGEDKYGNVYYENPYYFFLRNRWVIYPYEVHLDYDARLIPPDWHAWLHYTTDLTPCEDPIMNNPHRWQLDRDIQPKGKFAYYPYSTVREKMHIWKPKKDPCS